MLLITTIPATVYGELGLVFGNLCRHANIDKNQISDLDNKRKQKQKTCEMGRVVCELLSTQNLGPKDL